MNELAQLTKHKRVGDASKSPATAAAWLLNFVRLAAHSSDPAQTQYGLGPVGASNLVGTQYGSQAEM